MTEEFERARRRKTVGAEAFLVGALVQIDYVLASVQELRHWDPEGWRLLRAACFDLKEMLATRLEDTRAGVLPAEDSYVPLPPDISDALARARIYLDRLSLPKAAWEGWWATASRLKRLETRLMRDRSDRTAVA